MCLMTEGTRVKVLSSEEVWIREVDEEKPIPWDFLDVELLNFPDGESEDD